MWLQVNEGLACVLVSCDYDGNLCRYCYNAVAYLQWCGHVVVMSRWRHSDVIVTSLWCRCDVIVPSCWRHRDRDYDVIAWCWCRGEAIATFYRYTVDIYNIWTRDCYYVTVTSQRPLLTFILALAAALEASVYPGDAEVCQLQNPAAVDDTVTGLQGAVTLHVSRVDVLHPLNTDSCR